MGGTEKESGECLPFLGINPIWIACRTRESGLCRIPWLGGAELHTQYRSLLLLTETWARPCQKNLWYRQPAVI